MPPKGNADGVGAGGAPPRTPGAGARLSISAAAEKEADAAAMAAALAAAAPPAGPTFRPPSSCFARCFYYLAGSKYFERFILLSIFINSVTLALYDPRQVSSLDERLPLQVLDDFFMGVFVVEMLVKVSAYGWYTTEAQAKVDKTEDRQRQAINDAEALAESARSGKEVKPAPVLPLHFRYLDDGWNRLDFFIVAASMATYVIQLFFGDIGVRLNVLRTLRMLRPLRTINSIPEMRVLIDSLAESAKPMANVMLLCMFLFLVFALIGQQLFSGSLTQRCFRDNGAAHLEPGSLIASGSTMVKIISKKGVVHYTAGVELMPDNYTSPIANRRCGGNYKCPAGWQCRISGQQPVISNPHQSTFGGIGGDFANPSFGVNQFDDIGHALINIFTTVTLEGWTDQMYWLQDSYGRVPADVFFITLVVFGALFALNLALAVISDNYSANVQRDAKRIAAEKVSKEKRRNILSLRKARQEAFEEEEVKRRKAFEDRAAEAAAHAATADAGGDEQKAKAAVAAMAEAAAAMAEAAECERVAALEAGLDPDAVRRAKKGEQQPPPVYRPRGKCRQAIFDFTQNGYFENAILLCIGLNTLTLAVPYYTEACLDAAGKEDAHPSVESLRGRPEPGDCVVQGTSMDKGTRNFLEAGNTFFLYVFTSEALSKIIGMGWSQYQADRFNLFDITIVSVGYLEYLPFATLPGGGGMISAFRIFRLARVFKAAKYWPSMQAIIKTLIDTLPSLGYLTVVLFLLMFIAACTGVQLFGDVGIPLSYRTNFGDFGTAMLTVFGILCGDNWNEVMYMAIGHTSYWYAIYFIIVFVVGGFVILNLYLAILLSAFDCGEPPEFSIAWMGEMLGSVGSYFTKLAVRKQGRDVAIEVDASSMSVVVHEMQRKNQRLFDDLHQSMDPTLSNKIATKEVERHVLHRQQKNEAIRRALRGKSCGCISKHNRIRLRLARMVHTQRFDNFILTLIMISTCLLALESPSLTKCGTDCPLFNILIYADVVFTLTFVAEMAMKIIVYGFISTKGAYLKDPWNVLDFFIVMVSVVSLTMDLLNAGSSIAWIRSLRALRALRPLRTIKRAPGIRMAVNTLFDCAPAFLNIGCVAFVFYLAFAIIGVEFFGGTFWYCNDPRVLTANECVGTFRKSVAGQADRWAPRKWINPPMNFDNTGTALLTLFEVASLEMWQVAMYSATDSVGMGHQPQRNFNKFAALYFVVFILFGSFLVMNLFVGAVVDNFNRQSTIGEQEESLEDDNDARKGGGQGRKPGVGLDNGAVMSGLTRGAKSKVIVPMDRLMTPGQRAFVESCALIFSRKPITRPTPPHPDVAFFPYRRWCYNLVMWGPVKNGRKTMDGSYAEMFIMSVVLCNTIAMLCYSWEYPADDTYMVLPEGLAAPLPVEELQNTWANVFLDGVNNTFTFIFNVELVLKLVAWGYTQYWSDTWNRLDWFIVAVSDAVFVLESAASGFRSPINPNLVRILRLIKLMRILRVLSRGKEVLFLIETLVYSFPAIANVAALWLLVIFIYTVIGVSLYGEMDVHAPYKFGLYNEYANFATFGTGIVTLFRMSTGESWNGIMHDVMSVHPTASLFFFTYMLIVAYLLFNLLVAIVLQQFHMEAVVQEDSEAASKIQVLGGDQMACFQDEWVRFDPFASQYVLAIELPQILKRLPADLCPLTEASSTAEVIRTLARMSVNVDSRGRIHFAETYIAVIQYAYNLQIQKAKAEALAASGPRTPGGAALDGHGNPLAGGGGHAIREQLLDEDKDDTGDLGVAAIEGLMSQIVAHYPRLATQQLTDKPIVEFYAAQRLQGLWHRANARKNWDAMMVRLREMRDAQLAEAAQKQASKRGYFGGKAKGGKSPRPAGSSPSTPRPPASGPTSPRGGDVEFAASTGASETKDSEGGPSGTL